MPPENEDLQQDAVDTSGSDAGSDAANEFSIPSEYAEKGWTKFFEGKSGDDLKTELFKSYDSQQSLIGKKVNEYLTSTDLKSLDNFEDIKRNRCVFAIPCNVLACMCFLHRKRSVHI